MKKNIFDIDHSKKNLSDLFLQVANSYLYSPARNIMQEIFNSFNDVDGNFIEQFQTTGFDQRILELYLFKYFQDSGFDINRKYKNPDFIIRKHREICVEATTSKQSPTYYPPIINSDELITTLKMNEIIEYLATRVGSALFSKYKEEYWEKEHIQNKPLIFAIENFSTIYSTLISDETLMISLYGKVNRWSDNQEDSRTLISKNVPLYKGDRDEKILPIFELPNSKYISAVLFTNSGTIHKFNRMEYQNGYNKYSNITMFRDVDIYIHSSEIQQSYRSLRYEVGDPKYQETWGQGLSMFHNPKALLPINKNEFKDFPYVAHHWLENDKIMVTAPDFHVLSSKTIVG
jgi:hypothetical protein